MWQLAPTLWQLAPTLWQLAHIMWLLVLMAHLVLFLFTAGDVFIHAKCNTPSKLFELAQQFMAVLPKGSVKNFEDIYSFVYKNGRDLSGFIDGK